MTIKWRESLLLGFLLTIPLIFNPLTGEVETWKFYELVIISLFLALSAGHFFIKNKILKHSIIVLILCGGLSTMLADDIYLAFWGSWDRQLGFVAYLCSILLALSIPKLKEGKFQKTLITSGSLAAIAAVILAITIPESLFEGRIGGTTGNPNILGQLLSVTLFLTLLEFFKNPKKISIIATLLIQGLVFIETGNRASWVALILVMSLFVIRERKGLKKYFAALDIFLVILGLFKLERVLSFDSIQTRLELYSAGLKGISENPLFGVGFEHIQNALYLPNFTLTPDRIHQIYLDAALSAGIPFALALLALSIATLIILLKNHKTLGYMFLILLISLQSSFFTVIHLALFFMFVGFAIQSPIQKEVKTNK